VVRENSGYMEKGQSAIEYLMTYGWMFLVIAIVGGAIYASVQDSGQESPERINTTQVSDFLEDRTGYTDCSVERNPYEKTVADAVCSRSIGEQGNMSFESGKKFTAELRNGSVLILTDYSP
jgi:hypothetical protein